MRFSIITGAVLCAITTAGLVSCGSGGSSSTAVPGSTVVGTISGFGSIIMDNGVEYSTDGLSDCEVDNVAATGVCEESLSTGMHVTLKLDADGAVTALKYDDELEGKVTPGSVTGTAGVYTMDVFGVTVKTTSPGTQWDKFSANPPLASELDAADIEISGEWQQDGTLLASYIEMQSDDIHEVEGVIDAITGTDFTITLKNGKVIDVDGSALNPLPEEGDYVEIEGRYIASVFVASASRIEDEDDFDGDSEAEITGTLAADSDSTTGYSIGNTDVDFSGVSSCAGLVGSMVEAEGRYDDATRVLTITECSDEEEDMEAKCMVGNNALIPDEAKPKVGSIECGFQGTTGGPVTIRFEGSPNMAMFSGDSRLNAFDLRDILSGACVEIKFRKDASGDYIAGLIELEEETGGCDTYKLEGALDGFNDGVDITVLGVTFGVTAGTTYNPVDKSGLNTGTNVSIKDSDADGVIDEVEVD